MTFKSMQDAAVLMTVRSSVLLDDIVKVLRTLEMQLTGNTALPELAGSQPYDNNTRNMDAGSPANRRQMLVRR